MLDDWRFDNRRIGGRLPLLLALLAGFSAHSAAPALDQLFPIALQAGTTNLVEAVGKFDPWPPKAWINTVGVNVEPTTNKGSLRIVVDSTAASGPHFIRLFNDEGASAPKFLIVTAEPPGVEKEPNDLYTRPQLVASLPVTINGRLEKSGDVDSFGIELEAGETLSAGLQAHVLMSPLDAVLRLVDQRGVTLASNHDDGRSLDPLLVWTAPSKGTYTLQAFGFDYPAGSDIKFAGNPKCVYRLELQRGPFLRYPLPLGVQRGAKTTLSLHPWNLATEKHPDFVYDGTDLPADAQEAILKAPGFVNTIPMLVGDGPEVIEREPNNSGNDLQPIQIPGAVSGVIDPPGDLDRYSFTARQGDQWVIAVQSTALGFPLDAWLRIEDVNGKELARNDDADSADPRLDWTAPGGTNFVVVVGGLGHQGGGDYLYRLSFVRAEPSLRATVSDHAFTIEGGKTNEIKVTVTRRYGLTNPLTVSVQGLPKGVQADGGTVSEKGGETIIKLVASTNAPPHSGPIRMDINDSVSHRDYPVVMELVSKGENNGVPQGFRRLVLESVRDFWLTVRSAPKP